jgi:hypothetical protein
MKKLIFIILLISTICSAQVTHKNGIASMSDDFWYAFLDSAICYKVKFQSTDSISKSKDTIITDYENVMTLQSERLKGKDSIIKNQKLELVNCKEQKNILINSQTSSSGIIRYEGTFIGINLGYIFADSILTKSTVINGIDYGIYCKPRFTLNNNLEFEPCVIIPLSKKKFGIFVNIGYKIF